MRLLPATSLQAHNHAADMLHISSCSLCIDSRAQLHAAVELLPLLLLLLLELLPLLLDVIASCCCCCWQQDAMTSSMA
jgi:hypothetical protein